jgi:hypothetical protein
MKSYSVKGRPATAAPLARLQARYSTGEPVTVQEAFVAAGLTAREAHVLLARTFGRSHGAIASDDAMLKADGAPVSRQRVEQIEHDARRKLALSATVAVAVHAAERAGRSADLIDRGRRVRLSPTQVGVNAPISGERATQ